MSWAFQRAGDCAEAEAARPNAREQVKEARGEIFMGSS
jgi:hypothetical protein